MGSLAPRLHIPTDDSPRIKQRWHYIITPLVAALGELTRERTMEVSPALENLSLDELEPCVTTRDNIVSFITAGRLLDHTTAILRQKRQLLPNTDSGSSILG